MTMTNTQPIKSIGPCPFCGCAFAVAGDDGELECQNCGFFRPAKMPPRATVVYDPEGEEIYHCPHCGNNATADECGVLGAEIGCLFCNACNGEFET